MLFSGTGSTGGSGTPAAAAPSSPVAPSAVEILIPGAVAVVRVLSAIANGDDRTPSLLRIQGTGMGTQIEIKRGTAGTSARFETATVC